MELLKRKVLNLAEMAELENAKAQAAQGEANIEDLTNAILELAEIIAGEEE